MEEVKYIPGDLVKINGVVNVVVGIFPKYFANDYVIMARSIEGFDRRVYEYNLNFGKKDSIVPIPITKDFLDKNDLFLRYSEDEYHTNVGESEVCICDVHGNGVLEVTSAEYTTIVKLQYVHELQHLLFGLGLDSSLEV